jgi:hypothetical protein
MAKWHILQKKTQTTDNSVMVDEDRSRKAFLKACERLHSNDPAQTSE